MRQITDPRAPFPTIEAALDAGHEHLRQQAAGGSPVAIVAEEQPGGYFARIVWTSYIGPGGRRGRKKLQHHTAEVGKIDGAWLQPLNKTWLSGKPYYCLTCGFGGAEVLACESCACNMESNGEAQSRLVAEHQRRAGGGS